MKKERCNIVEMIKGISKQISLLYAEKEIHFETQSEKEVMEPFVDPQLAERALYNILHNAFKFAPQGGHVAVSVSYSGDKVNITVRDNGPGIDREDLPFIFERFYRSASARREEGTGIGLAVARELVTSQGGEISAESKKGEGSTFVVTFPCPRPDSNNDR